MMNKKTIYTLIIGGLILTVVLRIPLFLKPQEFKSEHRMVPVRIERQAASSAAMRPSLSTAAEKDRQKQGRETARVRTKVHDIGKTEAEETEEAGQTVVPPQTGEESTMAEGVPANLKDMHPKTGGPAGYVPTDDEIQASINAKNRTTARSDNLVQEHEAKANAISAQIRYLSPSVLSPKEEPNHEVAHSETPPADLIEATRSHKYIAH